MIAVLRIATNDFQKFLQQVSSGAFQIRRVTKAMSRHRITKVNYKLPQPRFPNQTRNQLSVCQGRESDRTGRHPECVILKRHIHLFAPVYIYHQTQMPARLQELPEVGHFVHEQKDGHIGRRA